ncbi:hypothetical protein M885DRAFT_624513 [Pelagophyceae sp. CCMP2097]|nr:hypothetical protein M885DRAFT_624513 [Pelagophyceae sp. CCMP2097]
MLKAVAVALLCAASVTQGAEVLKNRKEALHVVKELLGATPGKAPKDLASVRRQFLEKQMATDANANADATDAMAAGELLP